MSFAYKAQILVVAKPRHLCLRCAKGQRCVLFRIRNSLKGMENQALRSVPLEFVDREHKITFALV
jgi:hypothetical protein